MPIIRIKKETDTMELVDEFEKHYNERIRVTPGVERQVIFEDWASQKVPALRLGIFELYSQPDQQ